jgi:hypothetical protein
VALDALELGPPRLEFERAVSPRAKPRVHGRHRSPLPFIPNPRERNVSARPRKL